MDEAKAADCTALRPLALKLAKVYKPRALVVKKTELMEGVADTHDMRPRRKGGIVDWLIRVLYKLEYSDHGLLTYAGVVALLEKHEWPSMGWNCHMVWMGDCRLKKNLGGIKPIVPCNASSSRFIRFSIHTKCYFGWNWNYLVLRSRSPWPTR